MTSKRLYLLAASVLLFGLVFWALAASAARAQDGNGLSDPTLEPSPTTPEPVEEPLAEQPTPVDQPSPTALAEPTAEPSPTSIVEPTVEPSPTTAPEPTYETPADEPEPLGELTPVTSELTEEPLEIIEPLFESDVAPMQVLSDIVLEVSSEVSSASYDEYHRWSIEKTVSEAELNGVPGDDLTWVWTVTVSDEPVRRIQVDGTFTLHNPSDQDVTVQYMKDYLINGPDAWISGCTLDGIYFEVGTEYPTDIPIPAKSTLVCYFEASEWISADYWGEMPSENYIFVFLHPDGPYFEATTPFSYSSATDVVNESAWIQDEQVEELSGGLLVLANEAPRTWVVPQSHTCLPSDAEEYAPRDGWYGETIENTATVQGSDDGEGQGAAASVAYACYNSIVQPVLALTVEPYFGRQWFWDVIKYGNCDDDGICNYGWFGLEMLAGESRAVAYKVEVETTSPTEARGVRGVVTISNPDTNSEMNVDWVTIRARDNGIETDIDVAVDCGDGSQWGGIPPLGELMCSYDTKPASLDFDSLLVSVEVGGVPWRFTEPVVFNDGDPFVEYDATVIVVDSRLDDPLGIVEVTDGSGASASWLYSHVLECPSDPETYWDEGMYSYWYPNSAFVFSEDEELLDQFGFYASVTCYLPVNCTRGQGYWKTHSSYGPDSYDSTWRRVGEDTPFFLSGKTYYDMVATVPNGNAYYILAAQYVAAELNFLNGADRSAAQAAFDQSTALFNTYTPADIGTLKGNDPVRKQFLSLAGTLEQYNTGRTGPGSCRG